jgi:hypothetical protein
LFTIKVTFIVPFSLREKVARFYSDKIETDEGEGLIIWFYLLFGLFPHPVRIENFRKFSTDRPLPKGEVDMG